MTLDELKDKPHISYSQISCYMGCPLKYRFQYVDGIEPPFVSAALVLGSGIHAALNRHYQAHLEGVRLEPSELMKTFSEHWRLENEQREVIIFSGNAEMILSQGKGILEVFCLKAEPKSILAIEEPFSVKPGDGMPPLIGRIDLIEQDTEGTICVVDHKTASRRYSDSRPDDDLQMSAYALAARWMFPREREVLLRLDVLLKTREPDYLKYYTVRSPEDMKRFMKLAEAVYSAVQNNIFYPNPSYHCGQCPYGEDYCRSW